MTVYSQNKLMADSWQLTENPVAFVEGVGAIDQYGTYLDKWWSHGIIFYIRDQTAAQIEHSSGHLRASLEARLQRLNSDILANGATHAYPPTVHGPRAPC